MKIVLRIEVELSFVSGKFASKEDVAEALMDELVDPGTVEANEGEYTVESWDVGVDG